jgi:hypothetical protein
LAEQARADAERQDIEHAECVFMDLATKVERIAALASEAE